jgi:N-acetylmuramoyl-L-alanine amidase
MSNVARSERKPEDDLFSGPAGEGEYVVCQGDCLSSLAYERRLDWRAVWDHPRNAQLKRVRKNPYMLLPGDRVHFPDLAQKEVSCPADQRHSFVCKGVLETLRLVLRDELGEPRGNVPYRLVVDGTTFEGTTSPAGELRHRIVPNARHGDLVIELPDREERYELVLGGLDPVNTPTGVQARLTNLGLDCGKIDGIIGPRTRQALERFQIKHNLEPTSELDDATLSRLESIHGF